METPKNSPLKKLEELARQAKERGFVVEQKKVVSPEQALEIMGSQNFLGPEDIRNCFSIEVKNVPVIPFTKQELERGRELGQDLILYIDKLENDVPLTLLSMRALTKDKDLGDNEKLISQENILALCDDELDDEVPRLGWRLTSKECISLSEYKNFYDQTDMLPTYLKDVVFKGVNVPPTYADAIEEWENVKATNPDLRSNSCDWQDEKQTAAAQTLSTLAINNLTRERLSEAIFRSLVYYNKYGMSLPVYLNRYPACTQTNSLTRNGKLIYLGNYGSQGMRIRRAEVRDYSSGVGICLSRGV